VTLRERALIETPYIVPRVAQVGYRDITWLWALHNTKMEYFTFEKFVLKENPYIVWLKYSKRGLKLASIIYFHETVYICTLEKYKEHRIEQQAYEFFEEFLPTTVEKKVVVTKELVSG
jgi:hypothetical protein